MSKIIPHGPFKLMEAQAVHDPILNEAHGMDPSLFNNRANIQDSFLDKKFQLDSQDIKSEDHESMSDDDTSLFDYIFKKLESFGYPPRKLFSYKDDFVTEKMFSDGHTESEIVMPATYYGKRKYISNKEIKSMIDEISNEFSIFFDGAEKSDGKLTIKFTSRAPVTKSLQNDGVANKEEDYDVELDKVYGNRPMSKKASHINSGIVKSGDNTILNKVVDIVNGIGD